MPGSLPKRHHYIPEFYQRRWAKEGKVWRYNPTPKGIAVDEVSPRSAGHEYELYSQTHESDPVRRQAVETDLFSPLDNAAALALTRMERKISCAEIRRDVQIPGPALRAWSRFVLSMKFRSPAHLERLIARAARQASTSSADAAALYSSERPNGRSEPIETWLADLGDVAFRRIALATVEDLLTSSSMMFGVSQMKWQICDLPPIPECELITSDDPLMMSNGLVHRDSFLLMPVGPFSFFMAARHQDAMDAWRWQPDFPKVVYALNDAIARQATSQIISTTGRWGPFVRQRIGMLDPRLVNPDGFSTWALPSPF